MLACAILAYLINNIFYIQTAYSTGGSCPTLRSYILKALGRNKIITGYDYQA